MLLHAYAKSGIIVCSDIEILPIHDGTHFVPVFNEHDGHNNQKRNIRTICEKAVSGIRHTR
jgi:hypothetical protein